MSTSITINSLQRFDYEKETTKYGNPFDFSLCPSVTSNWVFKRRPFSRTALTKVTDAFSVKVCRVFIPKALVPVEPTMLFLQIGIDGIQQIDRQIGPHLKATNIFEGITGPCTPYPNNFGSYANVWTLYPSPPFGGTPTHWMYESCTDVSFNSDWKARGIHITIRDEMGYALSPPLAPANGITGFTGMCDFKLICPGTTGITGCKPTKCCPTYGTDKLAWDKQVCAPKPVCLPDSAFYPLFERNNQVMIVLRADYVEFDAVGIDTCSS